MTTILIIPTYNEFENILELIRTIEQNNSSIDMLFIDDKSPDGTGKILEEVALLNKNINVIHRDGKQGLGTAYITGFRWALRHDYDQIITMDADLSHDPTEIPALIAAMQDADMVIGSRYIGGIRIINWPLSRLLLSKAASVYIRTITELPIFDPTSGYRCYSRKVLESLDLDNVMSNGYSFLVEMVYKVWKKKFKVKEVPIIFKDRTNGQSKLSMSIFIESLLIVWKLVLHHQ